MAKQRFHSFGDFWTYYQRQHRSAANRRLHMFGTAAAVALLGYALVRRRPKLLALVPLVGYGPAWVGHLFFEKNRPATLGNPVWSLLADLKMLLQK